MTLQLPPEEPCFGPWNVVLVEAFVRAIRHKLPRGEERPGVVAIDGRSAGGKTTLARLLSQAVPASAVVHTDDIAWHHSFFDWSDLLLSAVLEPVRAGRGVAYRPPAWAERGRPGAIEVPSASSLVFLEGVGAARRELMHALDAVVWIQSDMTRARVRGIDRDGGEAAVAFWDEWMDAELVFLADQRPWERADAIVCGTPELEHDPTLEVVVAGELS